LKRTVKKDLMVKEQKPSVNIGWSIRHCKTPVRDFSELGFSWGGWRRCFAQKKRYQTSTTFPKVHERGGTLLIDAQLGKREGGIVSLEKGGKTTRSYMPRKMSENLATNGESERKWLGWGAFIEGSTPAPPAQIGASERIRIPLKGEQFRDGVDQEKPSFELKKAPSTGRKRCHGLGVARRLRRSYYKILPRP